MKWKTTRRITVVLIAFACASGCGDDGASNEIVCPDGATLTGELCLYDCPPSWSRGEDGRCHPACLADFAAIEDTCAPACPEGTTANGVACEPDGAADAPGECTGETYDTEGLTGAEAQVVYVDQSLGSPDGDGSESAPLDTITAALAAVDTAAADDVALVLGAGIYEMSGEAISLPIGSLKILGKCAAETILSATGVDVLHMDSPGMALTLRRIGIEADSSCVYVSTLVALEISDCSFLGADASALLFWYGETGEESLVVTHSLFSAAAAEAINVSEIGEVVLADNRFSGSAAIGTLNVMGANSTMASGNVVEGVGEAGFFLSLGGANPTATLSGNRFSGDWNTGAVTIDGESIPGASVELTDDSIVSGGLSSLALYDVSGQVDVDGLRLDSSADFGLAVVAVDNLTVTRSLLRSSGGEAVRLLSTGATALERCQITGGQAGVYSEDSVALAIRDSAITGTGVGVEVQGGTLEAQGNAIGANASIGMKVRLATGVSITGNVMASNYSTGIDLVSLAGAADAVYVIENNTLMESAGLGVSARSCGDGTISVVGNDIYGTLLGDVTNAGQTGELGDGIGILTGTDGVPSKARITGNAVGGNIRLGIIVDGAGAEAQVSENDFLDGNGYGRSLDDLVDSTPDLLYQDQAAVSGADTSVAQEVFGVYVSDDPAAEPPSFHGGGEPTHQ